MSYYIFIENEKLNGAGECRQLTDGVINLEVSEELYNAYIENPEMYVWDGKEIAIDSEYEAKQAQKEKERIAKLYLTRADVERGIYQAKGMDFEDIVEMVQTLKQVQGDELKIDIKALKIELKANNYYRGNPYVDTIGALLGFSEEQLNRFFEDGNYEHLLVSG